MNREEIIGGARLILGDCRQILPTVPRHDALVTDPPYGQSYKVNTFYVGGTRETAVIQRSGKFLKVMPTLYRPVVGDDEPFDPEPFLDLAAETIIWGAHKFADRLPCGQWLVWDKVPTGKTRDQGDGEAAWRNCPGGPMRIFRLLWDGLCVGKGARHEVTAGQKRLHPMQKPEALMSWCLEFIRGDSILDPFMGAGATGVAAVRAGRPFTGIELEEPYFDIACRRIEAAYRQRDMFVDAPVPIDPSEQRAADLFAEPACP
jgi:site-specific DNA-methyltransferase (adenine-specific)/modification methylase